MVYGFRRSEIEQNLLNMGALLTFALPPLKVHFENFIRDVESSYNVTDIMLKVFSLQDSDLGFFIN